MRKVAIAEDPKDTESEVTGSTLTAAVDAQGRVDISTAPADMSDMELTPLVVLRNLTGWLLITGIVLTPWAMLAASRWRRRPDTRWLHPVAVGIVVLVVSAFTRQMLFSSMGSLRPVFESGATSSALYDQAGPWVPPIAPFLLAAVCALLALRFRRRQAERS